MIKVLIADDMEPICRRYRRILETDPEIEVLDCVQTGAAAVSVAEEKRPDVVLMDVEMETKLAGLDAALEILSRFPEMKVIILTVYEDDEIVFQAFQNGVTDYFLKNSPGTEIITCVKDAYQGTSPIRPVIAQKIRREFQRVKQKESSFMYTLQIVTQLTQTELDILDLTCQGYTRSEICRLRCVELSTVKTQIRNILKKFEMESMSEVAACINGLGIIDYLHMKNADHKKK